MIPALHLAAVRTIPTRVRLAMTTLAEVERQFLALWAEMEALSLSMGEDWTDDDIDAWGDRLLPYQQRMERSACHSIEDAMVLLRQAQRLAAGYGVEHVGQPLANVMEWLAPATAQAVRARA